MLPEPDVPALLQAAELPPDERVVRGVQVRRDEGPAPVHGRPEGLQVLDRRRDEDLDPMEGVREPLHVPLRDPHLPEDLDLDPVPLRDPLRGADDRQPGAVEPLRVEDVVPRHAAVPALELRPEERDPEPQVLVRVHVRVGDRGEPLLLPRPRAGLIEARARPRALPLRLDLRRVVRGTGHGAPIPGSALKLSRGVHARSTELS